MTLPGSGSLGPDRLRILILGGGRKGQEEWITGDRIVLGRDPEADLRFDPQRDLSVSGIHAELRRESGEWILRDLDSTNGTFVNGILTEGPVRIGEQDVIRLGPGGPEIHLHLARPAGAPIAGGTARGAPVPRRRSVAFILGILVIGGAAASLLYLDRSERTSLERERDRLHATVDSLLGQEDRTFAELEGELRALADALEGSRSEVENLRGALASREEMGSADPQEVETLRRELQEATQALGRQQIAAGVDFRRIETANRPAVTLVFVETEDGRVVSGTGFAVRDDATLVTARHLLEDADGTLSPTRVAVQFSDSEQVWPARVIAVSDSYDLAVLQADNIQGGVPVIQALNARPDTLQTGSPVALLGFPLGGGPGVAGPDASRPPARPLLSAGVIRERTPAWTEIQGFGEAGASGSPVLDAAGEVVAVVYGGERNAPGGRVVAVPSDRVIALLDAAGLQ